MKYKGIIKVFLEDGETPVDVNSPKFIGCDFTFDLDENNHHPTSSGYSINDDEIYEKVTRSLTPILNHLVYSQEQEKGK